MPLPPGTKLGPYEIQSPLGAGGMGEVYRARDTRLDRTVAIKILPEHLSSDPQAKQRFEREARVISSVRQNHICTLFDIGDQDGISFLVMEYLEGETLEARLQKGPLPLKLALECGMQICDALEKAHKAGIVHRDLKPGNIMLTSSGAKLLDFGLAKPAGIVPAKNLTPSSPTMHLTALTSPVGTLTQQGMVVGTFQYMAPEVLQGQEADARSDIFSFGAVLYEAVTGKRAFEGKSQISVASAILEKEPEPISKMQPMAPVALDHVIIGCLAKEPESRWQSAADIARQLRWIASGASSVDVAPPIRVRKKGLERALWAGFAVILLAALLWSFLRDSAPLRTMRSYLPAPPEMTYDFLGDFSGPPAITLDGSAIAFCAVSPKDRASIWVQSLGELSARKLEDTEGASFPFWSPDNKFIGFFSGGHLRKVPAAGGPVTIIADATNPRGGSWNRDNVIIYEPDYRDSLWRVNANGDGPTRLTKLGVGKHTTHRWPAFLPDGKHFLFFATSHSGGAEHGIYFGSLDDGSYKHVLDTDSAAQYASGYLIFHVQLQLLAQKFDPTSGALSGDPITVSDQVQYDPGTWHTSFVVSQNGVLIYEPGSKAQGSDLTWFDRSGKVQGKVGDRAFYKGSGRISPDGKRLALSVGEPQADIWVYDLVRGSRTRLTFGGSTYAMPAWSADGQKVVYVKQIGSTEMSGTSLRARLANGDGQEEVLLQGSKSATLSPQFTPDGKYLLHLKQDGPNPSLAVVSLTGDKKTFEIVQARSDQGRLFDFRLSPDGRWLAYSSNDSGTQELYVTRFPSGQGRWQISQGGGGYPAWRADGSEIFFYGLDGFLHVAAVNPKGEEFLVSAPKALFAVGFSSPLGTPYDVSPDGQHFIFGTFPDSVSTPLVLVTNWMGDLKK
ncbi:MAG TPA: protein kinase [Terriglobales bacterium]|jgi:serine/threonine protein kinase|nr:protein kinase [Terriglobales bacterium]